MGKTVRFYKVGFENAEHQLTNISFLDFLDQINNIQADREKVIRRIGVKKFGIFSYLYPSSNREFARVVPLGKFRDNKPFVVSDIPTNVEAISKDVVDINVMYYDHQKHIALISTNGDGPKYTEIEAYLNTFLPEDFNYHIYISPIYVEKSINKLRESAERIRSLSIGIDLGYSVQNLILDDYAKGEEEQKSFISNLKDVFAASKNVMNGNLLYYNILMGQTDRKGSLVIDNVLFLLENINPDASCIKEICATYTDNVTNKLDIAKLKETNIIAYKEVKDCIDQVTSSLIEADGNDIITNNVPLWRKSILAYTTSVIDASNYELKIRKEYGADKGENKVSD